MSAAKPDVFSREFQNDPYPAYAWLREREPVYREPRHGAWVLTRYEDVEAVLLDPGTFSSAAGPGPLPSPGSQLPTLMSTDPPRHDQLRALVSRAFTPRRVASMAPRIEALAQRLVADLSEGGFDAVPSFAVPLPVIVIGEMLGVPAERQEDFRRWSDAFVGLLESPPTPELVASTLELIDYFHQLADARRAEPRDDLVSALLHAELDGQRLDARELDGFFVALLVAGNETTTNLISNQLALLASRPDLWKRLREDRSLVPKALEETLRFDSPVQNLGREVMCDVTIQDTVIPKGDRVIVSYGAANRDPQAFEFADVYDPERGETRHLAFGFGLHFCLGAGLARLEARVALEAMLDRYRELAPGPGSPRRLASSVIRGFESLPLEGRS